MRGLGFVADAMRQLAAQQLARLPGKEHGAEVEDDLLHARSLASNPAVDESSPCTSPDSSLGSN